MVLLKQHLVGIETAFGVIFAVVLLWKYIFMCFVATDSATFTSPPSSKQHNNGLPPLLRACWFYLGSETASAGNPNTMRGTWGALFLCFCAGFCFSKNICCLTPHSRRKSVRGGWGTFAGQCWLVGLARTDKRRARRDAGGRKAPD